MRKWNIGLGDVPRVVVFALILTFSAGATAFAHHPMGGRTPETFLQGLLSGFGHPIIGIDHFAFIVAMGVAVGVAGLSLAIPVLFIAASALGVALHVSGVGLPIVELVVATSVLAIGAAIAWGRPVPTSVWGVLFAIAGLFHGYAFGESIFGAESAPLAAYLLGLAIVQAALATGVALIARRSGAGSIQPRLAGATIAGIGVAILTGQVIAA